VYSDAKVANRYVWDFGWEMAHAAVSRRPPISLDVIVARTNMYTHTAEVWDSSIVPILRERFELFRRCHFCARSTATDDTTPLHANGRLLAARTRWVTRFATTALGFPLRRISRFSGRARTWSCVCCDAHVLSCDPTSALAASAALACCLASASSALTDTNNVLFACHRVLTPRSTVELDAGSPHVTHDAARCNPGPAASWSHRPQAAAPLSRVKGVVDTLVLVEREGRHESETPQHTHDSHDGFSPLGLGTLGVSTAVPPSSARVRPRCLVPCLPGWGKMAFPASFLVCARGRTSMPACAAVSWCCSLAASASRLPAATAASAALRCAAARAASAACSRSRAASPTPLHSDDLTAASVDAAAAAASPSAAFLCSLSCLTKSEQHAVSTRDEKRDSLAFTLEPCLSP
jgi:hypothetical protein